MTDPRPRYVKSFRASMIRFLQDLIAEAVQDGLSPDLAFFDLDGHAEADEIPQRDLLVLFNFSADVQDQDRLCEACLGVMTHDDPGAFRHWDLLDRLYDRLQPEARLAAYRAEDAVPIGWMVVRDGVSLAPMARSKARTLQWVHAQFLLSPAPGPAAP